MVFKRMLFLIAVVTLIVCAATSDYKFPIVYVYTLTEESCAGGLPGYIRSTLQQSALFQHDCEVIIASNYADCEGGTDINIPVRDVPNVTKLDTVLIESNRTREFKNSAKAQGLFNVKPGEAIWLLATTRFFHLEDYMISHNRTELLHVEADNLLYGKLTADILPSLRRGYKGLAATPLTSNLAFLTASVLWVSNLASLVKLNDFLLSIASSDSKKRKEYFKWLRKYECCITGGIDPDENGKGIKPYAVNEMTMLGYYHFLYPTEFLLLPVLPRHDYLLHKFWSNLTLFAIGGEKVGPDTGVGGIWDGASYGQKLGSEITERKHIVGQAINTNKCKPVMLCSEVSTALPLSIQPQTAATATAVTPTEQNGTAPIIIPDNKIVQTGYSNFCYTGPYVRCGDDKNYTKIHNLHVHSKEVEKFKSVQCECR